MRWNWKTALQLCSIVLAVLWKVCTSGEDPDSVR